MNTLRKAIAAALLVSTLAQPQRALSEEGGSGHYLPGSMSSFVDGVPPRETFISRYNLVYYKGNADVNQRLPFAGLETAGAHATSWAHGLTLLWRPPFELGERWSYALSTTIPYVFIDVSADVVTAGPTVRRSDSESGLGDIVMMPLMFNFNVSSNWNVNARVAVYTPTGEYQAGRLANTGKNYWSVEPTVGLMYFGMENGVEASWFTGIDFNTENNATQYRTGSQLHTELTLAQHFPLLGGLAGLGVNGYWYEQIQGDSGAGATLGKFEGRTAGLGPVLSHVFTIGSVDMIAEAKWLHEIETKNRLHGNIVWFKLVAKF